MIVPDRIGHPDMEELYMSDKCMYQVSTLQALMLGFTRPVVKVEELLRHGDTGLGTFESVDGEMIVEGGRCYRAMHDGTVAEADGQMGVPFASVCSIEGGKHFELNGRFDIDSLKTELNNLIEMDFGLNSMHMVRIDGKFESVSARSESSYKAVHLSLKEMLAETQRSFEFEKLSGTLVCVYYPDYMNGINAEGWHLHFISDDKTKGGHVFELSMTRGTVTIQKISRIEIRIPNDPSFDTYSLKAAMGDEIRSVEQGKS